MPALATTLKDVFDFSNGQIGQLGSWVYIGAVLGKLRIGIYISLR